MTTIKSNLLLSELRTLPPDMQLQGEQIFKAAQQFMICLNCGDPERDEYTQAAMNHTVKAVLLRFEGLRRQHAQRHA